MSLQLCPVRHAIVVGGEAHRLPDLSFRLLDLLLSRGPDPVSFSEIEQAVWNAQVSRETIKQRITLLRESLERLGIDGTAIEAVRNHGYRTTLQKSVPEPARDLSPRRRIVWFATLAVVVGAALLLAWRIGDTRRPARPVLAVVTTSPTGGVDSGDSEKVRRDIVRAISKFEGVQVIDRPSAQGNGLDYLVRLSLDRSGQDGKLATELVDAATGAVVFAEQYPVSPPGWERAVLHFANNVHGHLSAFTTIGGETSEDVRTRYAEAYRLWRLGDRQSLRGAQRSLKELAAGSEGRVIVRALLAKVQADLVMRHGEPAALVRQTEAELRALVARQPGIGDLRYALARTLLAQGKREEALDQLRIAQQTMPFLARDILSIEGQADLQGGATD